MFDSRNRTAGNAENDKGTPYNLAILAPKHPEWVWRLKRPPFRLLRQAARFRITIERQLTKRDIYKVEAGNEIDGR
jgi:hypothetical protein